MSTNKLSMLDIKTIVIAKIRAAAAAKGQLEFSQAYADGTWKVVVHANGSVTNKGYAYESRGHTSDLEALPLSELVGIAEFAQIA